MLWNWIGELWNWIGDVGFSVSLLWKPLYHVIFIEGVNVQWYLQEVLCNEWHGKSVAAVTNILLLQYADDRNDAAATWDWRLSCFMESAVTDVGS
jgi:hypothetical protein